MRREERGERMIFLKLENGHLDWDKQKRKNGHLEWDGRSNK